MVEESKLSPEETLVFSRLKEAMDARSEDSRNQQHESSQIQGYGTGVYVVNAKQLWNSILVLPQISFVWKPRTVEEITVESLAILSVFKPKLDFLVIGTGEHTHQVSP